MKKKIAVIPILILVVCGAFWAKGYYNDRYVVSDSFYTQIPLDEVNEDSWLVDADGVQQEKGREYDLIGYNQEGRNGKCLSKSGALQEIIMHRELILKSTQVRHW